MSRPGNRSEHVVVVVDDEPKIRDVVRAYLEREGYQVLEAGTAARALELATRADLMILDLALPDRAGEHVARQARASGGLPIIMLTAKASETDRIRGLQLGADDYMVKPFSPRELVARVQAVLRRSAAESTGQPVACFAQGALRIDAERREVLADDVAAPLTRSEFDLLAILAGRPGRVWSRAELLGRVQRDEVGGYERSVDVHVKNLRRKLGDDPAAPRFVATVPGVGYKLVADRDP